MNTNAGIVKTEEFEGLRDFLPEGSFVAVTRYLIEYRVHLTLTRGRRSKLGDYTHKSPGYRNHRISINGTLNTYAFLITLIHEIAHLLAFERYGTAIEPHGKEWKTTYATLLQEFLHLNVFPEPIALEIRKTMKNPGASTAAETGLTRVLKQYDAETDLVTIEHVPLGAQFLVDNKQVFKKGEKLRKRYKCLHLATNRYYLFQPLYEVRLLTQP